MSEQATTKVTDEFKPDPGDKGAIAPEAKPGIASMADAFKRAMSSDEPPPSTPPEKKVEAPTPTPKPPPKPDESKPTTAKAQPDPKPAAKPDAVKDKEENFRELREKTKIAELKVAELEKQLALHREGSVKYEEASKKLEAAEKRAAELDTYRKMYELESSEEFGQHFQRQITEAVQDAKDAVPGKASEVESIFQAPPGQWREGRVRELINGIEGDYERQSLIVAYNKLKSAQREKAAELDKARVEVNHEKLAKLRQTRAAEEAAQAESVREAFWKQIEPDIDQDLSEVENAKDVKMALRGIMSGKTDATRFADALKKSAKGYRLSKVVEAREAEIATLKEQLAALQSASPRMGTTGKPKASDEISMADKLRQAMGWKK